MWIADAKQMEPQAWSRLVTVFGPIVYRWCRVAGVPAGDAPDVVQEVFTSVARGIQNFERQKSSGSFRSWLATITRSRATDYFRRAAKQQQAAGGTEAMYALQQLAENVESTITPTNVQSDISKQLLLQVQAEFESTTWDAFWQTTIEGKSASEVAEATGLSRASVYQAKSRILKSLRKRLAESS
ncbi:ECF RNA polymerase sigma factor SigE [Roseimaritima multifibrata]|uniref:ECF RNA polymerase sigma factor SigE n=2 Tax=Roseimaritima multifibrata TaxID=1930274 RepID=A0A517MML8_9BACT|nr:ECF RNA polymerase sigma factor SigE [Roseimaritima multifibrata]